MAREIKFRGRNILNNDWMYGDLIHDDEHCRVYVYPRDAGPLELQHRVDAETIGQFTGLHDKNGRHKQMFNMMVHHAKSLRYYYEQLTDRTVTVLYDEDKDSKRIDQLLEDAGDLSRIYLTLLNCSQNGYDPQAIIDAMNRLIDHEPEPKRLVSNEIIDKFKVRI